MNGAVGAAVFIGVALVSYANCPGAVRAQIVDHVYVPDKTVFTDLGSSPRIVCVIGSSVATPLDIPPFHFDVPTYFLKDTGWQPITTEKPGDTFAAVQVGTGPGQISSIPSKPQSTPSRPNSKGYINSGNLTFFVVDNATNFKCNQITYGWKNPAVGDVDKHDYPYPIALAEISIYPKSSVKDVSVSDYMTIDASNVDSFEMLLQTVVKRPDNSDYAGIGNPVNNALMSRRSAVTGPTLGGVTGGPTTSPFVQFLLFQANINAQKFANLALAASVPPTPVAPYPYARIIAPDKYLSLLKCQAPSIPNGPYIPSTDICKTPPDIGRLVHLEDPLSHFFDSELETFFKNAVGTPKLVVMGDQQDNTKCGPKDPHGEPTLGACPWTVEKSTTCPVYLNHSTAGVEALQFGMILPGVPSIPQKITLCNPLNQMVALTGTQPGFSQNRSTATITFKDANQCSVAGQKYKGWNFVQPSSSWVGRITGVNCPNMTLEVLKDIGTFDSGGIHQKVCEPTDDGCPRPHDNWEWYYSNVAWVGTVSPFFSASDQVLGNRGAFADWIKTYYDGVTGVLAKSIGRNIVQAFSHGIANCNNITTCPGIVALRAADMNPPIASTTSSATWAREENWYRPGGTQDYYAQYLHTGQIPVVPPILPLCPPPFIQLLPIFVLPQLDENGHTSAVACSAGKVQMGMAYGFGFDESPGYLATPAPNVPSKFDAIPTAWFPLSSVELRIGRSQ